jgi:hypothetical protein
VKFLRLEEIIYIVVETKKLSFARIKITRRNVSFVEFDQYATIRLKRSKMNIDHSEVQIILTITNENTCLVFALKHLFQIDSQLVTISLFRLKTSFSRSAVIFTLRKRFITIDINSNVFSEHSFRKSVAQHASNHEMLDENIQCLERWTSRAFQLYFKTFSIALFNLNLYFQKRTSLTVSRVITISNNITLSTSLSDQINQVNRNRFIEFVQLEHDLLENLTHWNRHTNDTCHVF